MASLLDLAEARLRGLLDVQRQPRPSMVGLLGGKEPQGTLASTISGYTPPQMQAMSNQQVMDYARNVASSAKQNLQNQMSDLDRALVMDQGGINVGDRQAFARLMEQVPGLMGAVAYHGTPHTIRGKFDISKVGTGEGAQAYGHGMYFAESPKTAEYYKDLANNILYTPEGQAFNFAYELNHPNVRAAMSKTKSVDAAINRAKELIKNTDPNVEGYRIATQDLQILENLKAKGGLQQGSGNLYKVDIPDEYIPNMLDWDKPLREQPEILKTLGFDVKKYDKLKAQREAMPEKFDIDIPEELAQYNKAMALEKEMRQMPIDTLGKYFYEDLIKKYGTQKAISEALAEKGIKGIRYLDAGSRGKAAERSSNFVVFDPSEVKILEKNKKKIEGLLD